MASQRRGLMGGLSGIIACCLLLFAASTSATVPSESPSAGVELICHTDNPAECYPKVFVATDEFQAVHEDQDLPPGLHVQLDMQTGQLQAKINDPSEVNPDLEGLPVDQDVLVVDGQTVDDDTAPRIPRGAPAYDPVGAVKEPQEKNEFFAPMTAAVKSYESLLAQQPEALDQALADLEDISHDMYYGLLIAEDTDALEALFCLALARRDPAELQRPLADRTAFLAASTIASAVRNNPPALRAVEAAWDGIMNTQCKAAAAADDTTESATKTLKHYLYHELAPSSSSSIDADDAATLDLPDHNALIDDYARYSLLVLEGALRSPTIRDEFLSEGGMRSLLRVLLTSGDRWFGRRAKAARIVGDIFLDADNGAELGVWPRPGSEAAESPTEVPCGRSIKGWGKMGGDGKVRINGDESREENERRRLDDSCWEHHLDEIVRMRRGSADAEWSGELLALMRRSRPEPKDGQFAFPRDEL